METLISVFFGLGSIIFGAGELLLLIMQALFWFALAIFLFSLLKYMKSSRVRERSKGQEFDQLSGFWRYHPTTVFRKVATRGKWKNPSTSLVIPVGISVKRTSTEEANANAEEKEATKEEKVVAALSFDASNRHQSVEGFSELVDEVVVNANHISEVVVSINSPGGSVTDYGALYCQMLRLKEAGLRLVACIDKCGASGGYLAALPADEIRAAPLALVGSVGVVAFVPNIHELLGKVGVVAKHFYSGKFKRTVTSTDEITEEAQEHFQGKLESIHDQFKALVSKHRPMAKIDTIGEADHWTAQESLTQELGLVDTLEVFAQYVLRLNQSQPVLYIEKRKPRTHSLFDAAAASLADSFVQALVRHMNKLSH